MLSETTYDKYIQNSRQTFNFFSDFRGLFLVTEFLYIVKFIETIDGVNYWIARASVRDHR